MANNYEEQPLIPSAFFFSTERNTYKLYKLQILQFITLVTFRFVTSYNRSVILHVLQRNEFSRGFIGGINKNIV